ncbi:alpha-L-fucosidase [Paenibacillus soyae]|uniref:Alpha-L-fucosidase n=1 Tax=Paenibacillus soyae TaxID=2969249 RepID=A0A9X2MSY3_9BACL|nr:alpha-L-fucosidase [Paenibacillus soyae]MCR2805649.1 alpha-L-fucosidase [Paenibacillus soyae]
MNNKLLSGRRGYLIDCHRGDLPEVTFAGFDPSVYADRIRAAGFDNMIVYAKDHWGYAYYPSRIGPVHPKAAEAGLDLLQALKQAGEGAGAAVSVYYSVDTDHYAAKSHPQWKAIDAEGRPIRAGGRWFRCCIRHGYREYMLAQLREILENYKPEGLYLDCFPSVLCFCGPCQEQYKKATGRSMPLGSEANERWRELYDYEEAEYWLPFARSVHELIQEVSPGTMFTTNGCNAGMPRSIRRVYDYHFAEPWAGNFLSAGFVRDTMTCPQVGPGNIGSVYDHTPVTRVARELISIGMQGARPFLYSESMKADGSPVGPEWDRIEAAYKLVSAAEAFWGQGAPPSDISILYSELSHRFDPAYSRFQPHWWERSSVHLQAVQTAMSLCASKRRGCRIIEAEEWREERSGRLMLVPGAQSMTLEGWLRVEQYVRAGGRAIVTLDDVPRQRDGTLYGPEGEAIWESLFGCRLLGRDTRYQQNGIGSYLQFDPEHVLCEEPLKGPLAVCGPRLRMDPLPGTAVWGRFSAPLFEEDTAAERWMAWRSPEPSGELGAPAVIRRQTGAGEVVLVGFDLFAMARGTLAVQTGFAEQEGQRWHWPGQWLRGLMQAWAPPSVRVEGLPEQTLTTWMLTEQGELQLHVLNEEQPKRLRFTVLLQDAGRHSAPEMMYPIRRELLPEPDGSGGGRVRVDTDSLYTVIRMGKRGEFPEVCSNFD